MGLFHTVVGEGPPLVFLHGAGPGVTGLSNFAGNLEAFSGSFRCIVPALPGFGASPCPPLDRPFPEVAAAAVVELLDELGIEQASFLGNSMGAFVAAEIAFLRPAMVDRLALMGFGGIAVNILGPSPSEGGLRSRAFAASPSRESLVAWLETMVSDPAILTEELVETRWAEASKPGAAEHLAAIRDSMHWDVPRWAEIGRITAPTLLVWGRDDRMVPWEHALLPLRQLPDVELRVFSRCGHWAQVERKADFERVVVEFLTRSRS